MWKTRRPVYFQDFLGSEEARIEHWDYKLEGYDAFREARPNKAHLALAELETLGKLLALVTQNIDGLHQDAGNSPQLVIELHGTNRRIECLSCSALTDPEPAFREFRETRKPPLCPCGGFLKTATVSFGQAMPQAKMERAVSQAARADLVIAIGSTLEVEPAASVPLVARHKGAPYVIINRGATAHDAFATLRLEGDAAVILPKAVDALGERRG